MYIQNCIFQIASNNINVMYCICKSKSCTHINNYGQTKSFNFLTTCVFHFNISKICADQNKLIIHQNLFTFYTLMKMINKLYDIYMRHMIPNVSLCVNEKHRKFYKRDIMVTMRTRSDYCLVNKPCQPGHSVRLLHKHA